MGEIDGQNKNGWKKICNKKNLLMIVAAVIIIGAGSAAALVKASDNPAFCSTCHIMQSYYQSWQSGSLLASKHAAAGVACHDCHESSISIQASEGVKFITGNYTVPLEKRKFSKDFCLKCHAASGTGAPKGAAFEEVKMATNFKESNPHDSHNGEQDCNVCHNMHQESTVMCSQCHRFDWINQLDTGWAKK